MTFGLLYAFSENFVLPLSPRRSRARQGLAARARWPATTGRSSRTCAPTTRFMWGYPGKKLLFMGQEFAPGQRMERRRAASTGDLLDCARASRACSRWCAISTGSTARTPALHARDCEGEGFEWLIVDDAENSVFAWLRKAPGAAAGRGRLELHAGPARRLRRAAAAGRPLARDPQHRRRASTAAAAWATCGGVDADAGDAGGIAAAIDAAAAGDALAANSNRSDGRSPEDEEGGWSWKSGRHRSRATRWPMCWPAAAAAG